MEIVWRDFFSTCWERRSVKPESGVPRATSVCKTVIKVIRSNKGAVKTAPEPGALFISSIKVSVNRGLNKAELTATGPLYAPV